jgi:predicted O-methyltransferase YrrM
LICIGRKNISTKSKEIFFIDLLFDLRPNYCLETGFATGTSSATILAASRPKKMICVSLSSNLKRVADRLEEDYHFKLIEDGSQTLLTDEFFEKEFGGKIDFYHVDGAHNYSVVKMDLAVATKHLRKDGIMIVDDYKSKMSPTPDVDRAVEDFMLLNSEDFSLDFKDTKSGKGMAVITCRI